MPAVLRLGYTLLMVIIGWVIFRADTLPLALAYLGIMFGLTDAPGTGLSLPVSNEATLFIFVGLTLAVLRLDGLKAWALANNKHSIAGKIGIFATSLTIGLLCTMYVISGTYNPFIYFRF